MFFLNLTAMEFFTLLGVLGGLISLLYLLDRGQRRKVVSTLRFWTPARAAAGRRSRKRVQDPWSFLLQLAALLLLLLAIAQLQWGTRAVPGSGHILLLDTSALSAQQQESGSGTVMTEEKRVAAQYLGRVPSQDRVLLAYASGVTSPVTSFTNDRALLRNAIDAAQPGFAGLNLNQAFEFSQQGNAAEVVYIGPAVAVDTSSIAKPPQRLRLIRIPARAENAGIVRLEVHRDLRNAGWQATATVRNYGASPHAVRLESRFGVTRFNPRSLSLAPGEERSTTIDFTTTGAGKLSVQLTPGDTLPSDDSASIQLPVPSAVNLAVFTARPDLLRPLLESNHLLSPHFFPPAAYTPTATADVVVLDGFAPARAPLLPSLYIDPPSAQSPLRVKENVENAAITQWHPESGVSNGLHARGIIIPRAAVFQSFEGRVPVASVASGDVVQASPASRNRAALAVIGFDPLSGPLRFEITTPLLVGHLLGWLAPESDRQREFVSTTLGAATVTLDANEDVSALRVLDERDNAIPYTLHGRNLNLFAAKPSVIRVLTNRRERVLSLTLPDIAVNSWRPNQAAEGLPPARLSSAAAIDLWKYLAGAAALCLLAEWWFFGRARKSTFRRLPTFLKAGGLAVIAIALLQPHLTLPGSRSAVVLLVDTSKSITSQDLDRASSIAGEIGRAQGRNWLDIVPFSNHARQLNQREIAHGVHLVPASGLAGDSTNFEAAIAGSLAAMPSGFSPRIVLMSDGNDNQGSSARAIAGLQQMHVPVDTIPLSGSAAGALRLTSLSMPKTAFAGEQIPIDLQLESSAAADAAITLSAEGKALGTSNVHLQGGSNAIRLHAKLKTAGATAIVGDIRASGGVTGFGQAIALTRAKVLLLSQDPPESDTNLMKALSEAGLEITRAGALGAANPATFQLIILNNLDLNNVPLDHKQKLASYVRAGGGLILIGGDHQVYKEDKQADALDEALPAKLAPPKSPEGVCVALIVDKSSSMEGRKIELARISAIGVVEHLRPIDSIGVLIFDNSFQWAVPMRKAEDKGLIKRLIVGIVPDGGTQIAPALSEAYRKVEASTAIFKHVVLLTDGISEEGDSLELAKRAADHQVTISTVGLGQDVNRTYLERVASVSGGKSYFLNEPQGLEQILLKDVQDYSGSTAVEKSLTPIVDVKAEVLDGLDLASAPPLRGYTRFIAKPDARPILSIDPRKKDPLFVQWQFGLGRAAVFASDAKSRWAQDWMTWPGYDKFWINVSRDLLPHSKETDAEAAFDPAGGDLVVNYRLSPSVPEVTAIPPIYALGPDGFQKPVTVRRISDRAYQGRVHIGEAVGLFRLLPLRDSAAFPETGFYRQNEELRDVGANEELLKQISALTGGRFNPSPGQVFSGARTVYSLWQLWPFLLALAIAFTLAELLLRKWSGLAGRFQMNNRLQMIGLGK